MNIYEAKVHGKCPLNRQWDYYTLTITSEQMIVCEEIEAACNIVRGSTMTQENIADQLRKSLPDNCKMRLIGTHANVETTVEL